MDDAKQFLENKYSSLSRPPTLLSIPSHKRQLSAGKQSLILNVIFLKIVTRFPFCIST